MYPKIYLKPGKEKALVARHHWVFSGAIQKKESAVRHGELADVYSADHKYLGTGHYNERTSIAVRILTFSSTAIDGNFLWDRIYSAYSFRQKYFREKGITAYRTVFGEGDFLPGLIIDRYDKGVVVQLHTLGMDQLREPILEVLGVMMKPAFVYEKSDAGIRKEEGLDEVCRLHSGVLPEDGLVEFEEYGVRFKADIPNGQKTGFFLDQRENRRLVNILAREKAVLNCFGYTGGFSIQAALGGAALTATVDASEPALALARENFRLNGLDPDKHLFARADVFQYLRDTHDKFNLVILDPPAFAKNQASLAQACRGYKDINLQALKRIRPGGYLLTCSCSHYLDADTFQKILFGASLDAGREVQILARLSQPADHPVNVFHPESEYLKAFLCRVL